MRNTAKLLMVGCFALVLVSAPPTRSLTVQAQGQAPSAPAPDGQQSPEQQVFRATVDLVMTDVIVRDDRGQFIADLQPGEFEIYEDGVKQEIASIELIHGGRAHSVMRPPPAPIQEGFILPPNRPTNDAAGRIFLLFIDDLHLDFQSTPRTRKLLQDMLADLIHEGDMFGIVSTGTSSISEELTYDRQILESAVSRISGGGLRPREIIESSQGSQGPTEVRHRAHVAFSTAYDLMRNLERVQNRRKAVIYISSGYDFNPFEQGRREELARRLHLESADELASDPFNAVRESGQMLAEADLIRELAELTRAANRANATIYTIDPRGLVAGPDVDQEIDMRDYLDYVRETQISLRVLAEETGGIAVVNQNDFRRALRRIDAETSDYYVLGYYSSNPDPLKRTRRIEVRAARPGLDVNHRESYTLRPSPGPIR